MNKEEIEKALKLFDREDLINDIIEDLDTDIGVFMTVHQMIYYSNLQQENERLKDNWNKLKEWLNAFHKLSEFEQWEIVKKMQELEKGDSNE